MPERNDSAPLAIRLVFGTSFVNAGYRKLFTEKGHANIVHILRELNVPAPRAMSWVVGLSEFGGGLGLVTGTLTRGLAATNVINLLGNVVLASHRGGFPDPLPGQQPLPGYLSSFLGIGGLVSLFISGAGACSVDNTVLSRQAATRRLRTLHSRDEAFQVIP